MADDPNHPFTLIQRTLHLTGLCDCHIAIRLIIERPHDHPIAQQATVTVDLRRRQPDAA